MYADRSYSASSLTNARQPTDEIQHPIRFGNAQTHLSRLVLLEVDAELWFRLLGSVVYQGFENCGVVPGLVNRAASRCVEEALDQVSSRYVARDQRISAQALKPLVLSAERVARVNRVGHGRKNAQHDGSDQCEEPRTIDQRNQSFVAQTEHRPCSRMEPVA